MICDVCKKTAASVHFTEIINDEVTELHLCEECAKTKGAEMQQHFSIADLLSGLVDSPFEATKTKEHIKLTCPNCEMSYSDFKRLGKFGCAQCYEAFKRALYPLFRKIHGTARHVGKQPVKSPVGKARPIAPGRKVQIKPREETIEDLKSQLEKAIKVEEFEEAAVLRDKIRSLEQKGKKK